MISIHSISGGRRHAVFVAVSLGVSLVATGALAYTAEQQQACTGDAMRLCGAFVPDVDRITVCMIRNKAQLTAGCRAHFGATPVAMRAGKAARSKPQSHRKPQQRAQR
ncbi:hypothetical protein DU475_10370 [Rhodopseudomonas sp. WA056]|uniref:hypothetical protein n=1 Tax=Rhodopseudomonas sp. WA056 TaxID=2269367 RepID=UPI0013DEB87B|nr:hypothetical protein [Rhodopseudomonas sp. WA056]NEW87664.1 hypothetical protein [Rhodopseudomonas sp. WA056]